MMRFSNRNMSVALFLILALPHASADEAAQSGPTLSFEKVKVDVDDLISVLGFNVFKFSLDGPTGQDFNVVWRSVDAQGKKKVLHSYEFRKDQKEPTTLLVSFLRRDDKVGGVLLSDQSDAVYRLDCEGCDPGGMATVVALPLAKQRKLLVVHKSSDALRRDGVDEVRLISLMQMEGNSASTSALDGPRVELVVEPK